MISKQEKEKIDEKYFDMCEEDKNILKKFGLFYYRALPRYKVARALLILEDKIKKLIENLKQK